MTDHILAIDLGTGGPKVALVDDRGKVVAHEVETTGVILEPHGGAEQDPDDWWDAITRAVQRLVAAAPDEAAALAGVSVTSQWCGTVPVDGDGKAIGNAIIWMDSRGADAIAKVVSGRVNVMGYDPRRLARWVQLTGAAPSLSGKDSIAHILWLKEERPEVYDAAERLLEPGDYLNLRLTGKAVSLARLHRHALAHRQPRPRRHHLPPAAAGVDRRRQGQAAPAGAVGLGGRRAAAGRGRGVGHRRRGAGRRRPWATSTPPCVGCGAVNDYEPHLYLGTSSWLSFHLPGKRTDIRNNMAAFPAALPGKYFLANEHEAAGACLLHARDQLQPGRRPRGAQRRGRGRARRAATG